MREKQSYKTKYRGKILYISSKKNRKSKTSFTGAFDFLVQKGLMGQPHLNVAHKSANLFLIDGAMLKIGITMHVNQNMRLVVHQENLLSCNQLQDIMDMSQLLNKYIKTVVLKFQNTTFIAH